MCAATEVSIERHLEDILNNNTQAVVGAFQTEIKKTLKAQNRKKKASQASCISEIPFSCFITVFTMIYSFTECCLSYQYSLNMYLHDIDPVISIIFVLIFYGMCTLLCCVRTKRSCVVPSRSSSVLLSIL